MGTEFQVLAAVVAVLLLGFLLLIRSVASARPNDMADRPMLAEFDGGKYRPLARLFNQDDEEFLRTQRGFQPEMLSELRASRRQVAREYLASLKVDFLALHGLATELLAVAPIDQPELASTLASMKVRFFWGLGLAHAGLMLHAAGLDGVRPVAALADLFQGLHQQTHALASAHAASLAA
ncbi:MAG: hypothetical protein NTV70_18825 [Acidobacteria bacterium]|nr:hypothetical protein [Acidobacteriota bacterium]